jgi:hypothetical protein
MNKRNRRPSLLARVAPILVSLSVLGGATVAGAPGAAADDAFAGYRKLSNAELDSNRGGFIGVGGITYFSIDLAGIVNGQQLYDFHASLSNGQITQNGSGNGVSVDANRILAQIQNGTGNSNGGFTGTHGLVNNVQNSLSNVVIQQIANLRIDLSAATQNAAQRTLVDQMRASALLNM